MARFIALDSGPLGLACKRRGQPRVDEFHLWRIRTQANGTIVLIPEIVDYEVRRELKRCKANDGLRRLDLLLDETCYVPITTAAMRFAADLWAAARNEGRPTAHDVAIDADVILSAQAITYLGLGTNDSLTIATDNDRHVARYIPDARPWDQIMP